MKEALNDRIQVLVWELGNRPVVKITYFQPDQNKDGGAYITIEGSIKKIDEYERLIYMEDDTSIPIGEVISIEGKVFSKYF